MIKAAAPFERLLIRVPEAYLLLRHYETTRPGLLVLDADGRRVTSIDLSRALRDKWKPADVAKKLDEARKAPVFEHIRLGVTGGSLSKFLKSVSKLPGVRKAESDADGVKIVAEAGAARPDVLEKLAVGAKVVLEWDEPVVVDVMRKGAPLDEDINWRAAPGVWYSQRDTETLVRALTARAARVYATRLLLDPVGVDALHPRVAARLEMRTFDILNVPKGGLGARVAAAQRHPLEAGIADRRHAFVQRYR